MPVKSCNSDGKPGFKWGDSGKCYTYTPNDEASRTRAKNKAKKQGRAIEISKASDEVLQLVEMGFISLNKEFQYNNASYYYDLLDEGLVLCKTYHEEDTDR